MKALKSLGIALALMASVFASAQMTAEEREAQRQVIAAINVYKGGDMPGARTALEGLVEKNPNNSDALAWLGFIYMRMNEPAKAVPMLERALPLRPNDVEVMNNLGNAYMGVGQPEKALDQYMAITVQKPEMFEAWYNVGNIHLKARRHEEALKFYTKANELRPGDPYVLNNMGVVHEAMKNNEASAERFAAAATIMPSSKTFQRNAGFAYMRVPGQADRGLPFLERAYKMDNNDSAVAMALATSYARSGKRAEALKMYEAVEGSHGNTHSYWFNVGVLKAGLGDPKGAEAAYRKAMEMNGADIDTLTNLGLIVYKRGNYPEAEMLFDKLVGLAPDSTNAKVNLAAAATKTGNVPKAMGLWKQILAEDPTRTAVRLSLANGLWQQDKYDEARGHYLVVLKEMKSAEAHNGLGLYQLTKRDFAGAEKHFRASIALNSSFVPAYNNLAVALDKRKMRKDAIAVLQQALRLNPNSRELKVNLARMKAAG